MSSLHYNIIGIYGEKGKAWLSALPELFAAISSRRDLRDLKEVTNITHNYVLSGFRGSEAIILKLSLDVDGLKREFGALMAFEGTGVVQVFSTQGCFYLNAQSQASL